MDLVVSLVPTHLKTSTVVRVVDERSLRRDLTWVLNEFTNNDHNSHPKVQVAQASHSSAHAK